MRKLKYLLLMSAALLWGAVYSNACTSIIVSGKVTPDGRPYIFKNRDTHDQNNLAIQLQGSRYRFIAIVAAKDSLYKSVWSGHNEVGFAIANTAAYNLNGKHVPGKPRPQGDENDGSLMRKALETCRTLADFEQLLDSIKARGPIPSNSNFAVLDAEGGVAYYETGNKGYVKFDANDPLVAPYGFIVRTNHGMSGERSMDQGIERYMAMSDYATRASHANDLGFENIIRKVTRYLKHGLTHIDLNDLQPQDDSQPVYYPFRDFIPRNLTASAQLIQGVKKGEEPLRTTAWTIVGCPLTTVAIPLWITANGKLPDVVTHQQPGQQAKLVEFGLELKRQLFPIERGNGQDYINLARLINHSGTGILQKIEPIETEIIRRAKGISQSDKPDNEISEFYRWVEKYIKEQYSLLLQI
ncbi:MAG: acyl-CoA--6-aminopenicillanic acid acyl-transferase [Prevotella sp.]|nr:acyl-CoA--6-aminopenicillanic acid acyl-transferase [Prevotella sp.]